MDSEKTYDFIFKSHNLILCTIFPEKQLSIMVDSTVLSWPKSLRIMVLSLISYAHLDKRFNFLIQKMGKIIVPI